MDQTPASPTFDKKRDTMWFKEIKPLVSVVEEKDGSRYIYMLTRRDQIEQFAKNILSLLKTTKNLEPPAGSIGEHVSISLQVGEPGRIGLSFGFITEPAVTPGIFDDLG